MIRCGPSGETVAPAKMALRFACLAAAGSRPIGILRFLRARVICVVLNNNKKHVFHYSYLKKKYKSNTAVLEGTLVLNL
jgi:hypothetical protein